MIINYIDEIKTISYPLIQPQEFSMLLINSFMIA